MYKDPQTFERKNERGCDVVAKRVVLVGYTTLVLFTNEWALFRGNGQFVLLGTNRFRV